MEPRNDIKIVIFAAGPYSGVVKDLVIPTLHSAHPYLTQDDILVLLVENGRDLAGQTNDAFYKQLMLGRQRFYRDVVRNNRGKKLLFLDVDVVCAQPFLPELSTILDSCDFAMQQDYIAGIWGVNCTDGVVEFFENFVTYIESIEPQDRKAGFPQFELGDFIEKYRTNDMLNVIELPEKYGFLTEDMVLYHAINGGVSAQQKTLLLMAAHHFWSFAKQTNFENVFLHDGQPHPAWGGFEEFPDERECYSQPRSHPTLTWFAAFRESQGEELKHLIQPPGAEKCDWVHADKLKLGPDEIVSVLSTNETVLLYVQASWCGPAYTPRFVLNVKANDFLNYLGHQSWEQYNAANP